MKKAKTFIPICLLLVIIGAGIIVCFHYFTEPMEVIEASFNMDMAPSSPEDLYERKELIIIGTYLGDEKYFADINLPIPDTRGSVKVEEVIKGSCDEIIPVYFYGGEMPYSKFLAEKEAMGQPEMMKSTDPVAKRSIYRLEPSSNDDCMYLADAVKGQQYIIFLGYSEEVGAYMIGSAYSMRPLNDKGQALNPDTGNYETLHMLEEVFLDKENSNKE